MEDNAVLMRILFNAIIRWSEAPTFHREDIGTMVFSPLKDANQNLSTLKWPNFLSISAYNIFLFQNRGILQNHATFH